MGKEGRKEGQIVHWERNMKRQVRGCVTWDEGKTIRTGARGELDRRERENERDKTAKYLVLKSPAVRGGCGLVDPLEGVLTGNY